METVDKDVCVASESKGSAAVVSSGNAKSFLKNGAMLTGMGLMVSGLGLIYRIYMAKYLGVTQYGTYVFITTFIAYFGIISLFGYKNVIVRQVASARHQVSEYARAGIQLRFVSGIAALAIAIIAVLTLKRTEDIHLLAIVYALSIPLTGISDILDAVFLGLEKSEYSAISVAIVTFLKVVIGVLLLVNGYGLLSIMILFLGVTFLNVALNWIFLRYKLRISLDTDKSELPKLRKYIVHEALPFWYLMLLSKIYYKNDVLILGWLKGDKVVGVYSGAYMAIDVLLLLGGSMINAIFPIVSRMYANEPKRITYYFELLCKYILLIFVPLCIFINSYGAELIPRVLGPEFISGIDVLRVLIWMTLFETLTVVAGTFLCATGNQRQAVKISCIVSVMNLALTLILVPLYSYMGAAWATTSTAAVTFILANYFIKRVLPDIDLFGALSRVLAAACLMGVMVWGLGCFNRVLGIIMGFVIYVIALFVLKVISTDDRRIVNNILSSRKSKAGDTL